MTNQTYTDEQKQALSKLFAEVWYDALRASKAVTIASLSDRFLLQARERFEWFRFDGNKYAILRHLEEAGVHGVFWFYPERTCQLYFRVFVPKFRDFAMQRGLPKDAFVKAFMSPTSGAHKPTEEVLLGDITDAGKKRYHNRISPITQFEK